jgi:hypothetical protein
LVVLRTLNLHFCQIFGRNCQAHSPQESKESNSVEVQLVDLSTQSTIQNFLRRDEPKNKSLFQSEKYFLTSK